MAGEVGTISGPQRQAVDGVLGAARDLARAVVAAQRTIEHDLVDGTDRACQACRALLERIPVREGELAGHPGPPLAICSAPS